ncbi:MAG: PDZ domain-containing protein [Planctomycetes bacterium]|nr:PDZ domain-containing protein [Planctomycetota bacterium]
MKIHRAVIVCVALGLAGSGAAEAQEIRTQSANENNASPIRGGSGARGILDRKPPAPPNEPADPTRIADLVDQLSGSSYADREAAQNELRDIGNAAIEHLQRRYRQTDDFEARLRIRHLAESIYLWNEVLGRHGFLGVGHRPLTRDGPKVDRRIQPGKAAYLITHVVPGTSADGGGIKKGDIIVAVDGVRFPDSPLMTSNRSTLFADYIRTKPPGTEMNFDIYRGKRPLTLRIRIGYRPPAQFARGAATADLVAEYDQAVAKFPQWWKTRFETESLDEPRPTEPPLVPEAHDGD